MAKKEVEKRVLVKSKTKEKAPVKKQIKTTKKVVPEKNAKKSTAKTTTKTTAKSAKVEVEVKVKKLPKIVAEKKSLTKPEKAVAKIKPTPKVEKKVTAETTPLPILVNNANLKPIKSILISQPKPESGKSPYIDIAEQFKIKLDWRPFTHVEGVKAADFRKDKIYIDQYSCVIFTSRFAVEQYFRICEELRIKIKEENKYFCYNEAIALYLQKFINYRKRKVFFGDGKLPKLMELILKHKDDGKFLLPCSDVRDKAMAESLVKHEIDYSEAIIYNTVASDLSDLSDVKYDMLVFFNPSAIDSLYTNFPKFKQDETRLAIFGNTTSDATRAHKLNINVFSPTPENPSLVDAIKKYITIVNKKGK